MVAFSPVQASTGAPWKRLRPSMRNTRPPATECSPFCKVSRRTGCWTPFFLLDSVQVGGFKKFRNASGNRGGFWGISPSRFVQPNQVILGTVQTYGGWWGEVLPKPACKKRSHRPDFAVRRPWASPFPRSFVKETIRNPWIHRTIGGG